MSVGSGFVAEDITAASNLLAAYAYAHCTAAVCCMCAAHGLHSTGVLVANSVRACVLLQAWPLEALHAGVNFPAHQ